MGSASAQETPAPERERPDSLTVMTYSVLYATPDLATIRAIQAADLHDVSHRTVYKWIDRVEEDGPECARGREREGRPCELGKEARTEIERLPEGNPTEEDQNATRQAAPRIVETVISIRSCSRRACRPES